MIGVRSEPFATLWIKYPRFVRDADHLIKTAWSKSAKDEYEHKAQRSALNALVDKLYYRYTMYNRGAHPRIRLTAQQIDGQVSAIFTSMKQQNTVRDWFTREIRKWAADQQRSSREHVNRIERDVNLLRELQAKLLNLRLLEEIDADTFAKKNTELRDRIAALTVQIDATDRNREEQADLALATFELSQVLQRNGLRQISAKSVVCSKSSY